MTAPNARAVERERIARFLSAPVFAVLGASADPHKYGYKVLAAYLQHGKRAYPINPRAEEILGLRCYPNLSALPETVTAVSCVTPPAVTAELMDDAANAGARIVWMQPGAESPAAIAKAQALGLEVIAGGACVLVELT
ncbi:MAG: CoA-binding protein [Planctomycetota bacterium]